MASTERLIDVFSEAKTRPTEVERERFVADACGDDAELKQQVLSLLQAHDGAGCFLQPAPFSASVLLTEKPGDRIGRYELLQKIGEGGCGVVYMAEQAEPVRRRVALKVIKLGLDTRSVIARFEAEWQALALMDHPNIAKVLDAGATDTGRPYFVMELIDGTKITDYSDQNHYSTEERLKLFTQVCRAIQHAHQKGIIHRDIKPSNILVTVDEPGTLGIPKVIDFGIAKATSDQRLTDKTVFTAFEQFIGTPTYMSPEQALGTTRDIDTRADIYALGVLLYELLTGRTPFEQSDLLAAGVEAMRRTICEQEPLRPSTRVSTMTEADVAAVAKHRRSDGPRLIQQLRGDLDWIVMKCLEKDRARRYETAAGLAADVQKHLTNEPVVACPPSKLYRLQKLVRRNKLVFAAVAGIAMALVLGLGVASWGLMRERTARREAESARNLARAESARNEEAVKFLLTTIGPEAWRGKEGARVRPILLDFFSSRLGTELTNQPAAQGDLYLSLANGGARTGDYASAVTNAQRAVDAYRLAFGHDHVKVALAFSRLGNFQRYNKQFAAGKANAQEALTIARQCGDPETLAECLINAARPFAESNTPSPEAIPLLRENMHLRRRVVPNLLALFDSTRSLVRALQALAQEGKQDEAMRILQEELKEAPADKDLLRLLRVFKTARGGTNSQPDNLPTPDF